MMTLVREHRTKELSDNNAGTERRRGLRIEQHRPIKVFEPTLARYFGGQTQDVSATGLRIELPMSAPVQRGRLLTVHVGLSDTGQPLANRKQMIPAKVVWIDRDLQRTDGRMLAGLEFLASTAAHRDAA